MQQEVVTGSGVGQPAWLWLRDTVTIVLVWMRALLRLGVAIFFSLGVLSLLLAKSVLRVFGHPS